MSAVKPTQATRPTLLDRLPVIATLLVVVASGVLAADATRSVALRAGAVSDARLALLLPLIIEGGACTAGLLAWRRVRAGEGAWPERLALLALIALATAVNASHASGSSWLGVVLAACPPLVLVVSVELLLRNRGATEAEQAAAAQAEREEWARIEAERAAAAEREEIEAAKADERERRAERARERAAERRASAPPGRALQVGERAQGRPVGQHERVSERPALAAVSAAPALLDPPQTLDERVALVTEWLATEGDLSETAIGERLGVSRATGGRIKRAAKELASA